MTFVDDPFLLTESGRSAAPYVDTVQRPEPAPNRPRGSYPSAVTGMLHGFDLNDEPLVSTRPKGVSIVTAARTTIPLSQSQIGSLVVMVFELGEYHRPIIIGVIQEPSAQRMSVAVNEASSSKATNPVQENQDQVVLSAEREIVIRCGESSITLTRAGKVIISGKYVLSRSSGCNKIKGAVVDIN